MRAQRSAGRCPPGSSPKHPQPSRSGGERYLWDNWATQFWDNMITQYADIMMNPSWGWYALHLSWISVNIWYETKPDDVTWYDTWWYEHDMIPVSTCKTNLTTKNWVRQGDPPWCARRCPRCVKQHRSVISFALRRYSKCHFNEVDTKGWCDKLSMLYDSDV